GFKAALAEGLYGDLDEATVDSVLKEAGRFASDVIAPLNRVGDKFGTPFKDGNVTTPPGWKEAYRAWAAAGALHAYGTGELKERYLGKLVSGEWMGTMQLTEPQAGSDVGALRTKAE